MTHQSPWVRFFRLIWPVAAVAYAAVCGVAYVDANWAPMSNGPILFAIAYSFFTVLLCLVLAVLLYWRAQTSAMALHMSFFLLGWGLLFGGPAELIVEQYPGLLPNGPLGTLVLGLLLTTLLVRFPDGEAKPRWARWLIVISALALAGHIMYVLLRPVPDPDVDIAISSRINTPTFIALLTSLWRYRYRATHSERKQMKWVLYGVAAFFGLGIVGVFTPQPYAGFAWFTGVTVIPTFFAIAVLRYRLWDIDVVIRRTVQYAAVTAVLAAVYFGTVILMQSALVALTGQRSQLAVVVSTLVIAALFNPVRRRLQQFVDRAFYRRSYDAEQTLARFGEAMRDEMDVEHIQNTLFDAVQQTMQPEHVGLWLKSEHN